MAIMRGVYDHHEGVCDHHEGVCMTTMRGGV